MIPLHMSSCGDVKVDSLRGSSPAGWPSRVKTQSIQVCPDPPYTIKINVPFHLKVGLTAIDRRFSIGHPVNY